ncbi:YopX family protein [Lactiplantibacillus plantarum]|nr:YopX family protein [Lactiplantibacillus plantarum]MDT4758332.1 YopX family protein [Lactiplantibacillus plantarum]
MIKFRAWDKVQKVMMVPRDMQTDSDGNIFYVEAMGPDGEYDEGDLDVFKLEQFTGLKDVNGNEIYEGDILHFGSTWCVGDEYDPREEEHIGLVEYRPDYASYVVNCNEKIYPLEQVISFDGYSVHGNAHENPELLKG